MSDRNEGPAQSVPLGPQSLNNSKTKKLLVPKYFPKFVAYLFAVQIQLELLKVFIIDVFKFWWKNNNILRVIGQTLTLFTLYYLVRGDGPDALLYAVYYPSKIFKKIWNLKIVFS